MTNEIEKTFYDTFGIERKRNHEVTLEAISGGIKSANLSQKPFYEYPQITDRILLKLICIVLNTFQTFEVCRIMDIDSLKEKILKLSMLAKDEVYSEVRTLFEEVENAR